MPIGEKFTGDLATDTIRWRLAKILTEKSFRKVGIAIGESGPFRVMADVLKTNLGGDIPAQWLETGIGIVAAALLSSPRIVADTLGTFTGLDADKLNAILNEGVDSGIGGITGAMQQAGAPDADLMRVATTAVDQLDEAEKFNFLNEVEVIIFGGVIHDAECTEVLDRESQQRRQQRGNQQQQQNDDDRPRLRPGGRKVKLAKACDMGYSTISLPKCCGKAVEKLMAKEILKPTDLFSCVQAFAKAFENDPSRNATELTAKYYQYMNVVTDSQSAELRDLGSRKVWSTAKVADYLQNSTDVVGFLKHLKREQKVTEKTAFKKVSDAVEAVFSGKSDTAESAKLRENARKLRTQFERNAAHARRSRTALGAILRKR